MNPRSSLLSVVFLAISSTLAGGQVKELWRSGLTNSLQSAYTLKDATVDEAGNTIIGAGRSLPPVGFIYSALVAKFDQQGSLVWQKDFGTNTYDFIDSLATDSQGNVFVAVRLDYFAEQQSLTVLKLSPSGTELWRTSQPGVIQADFSLGIAATLKVNSAGDVIVNGLFRRQLFPGQIGSEQGLFKYDTDGVALWQTFLPGTSYFLPWDAPSKVWAPTATGGAVVAGSYLSSGEPRGFVAEIAEDGQLAWWTDEGPRRTPHGSYSSLRLSPKGMICVAGGTNGTIFSRHGKALRTVPDAWEVLDVTPEGGFLLHCRGWICAINAAGTVPRWIVPPRTSASWWDVVRHPAGGWVVVGVSHTYYLNGIGFNRLDDDGRELWQAEFPDYADWSSVVTSRQFVFPVADGTFRLIAPPATPYPNLWRGIGVSALQVD
jgi:hypothetical protein